MVRPSIYDIKNVVYVAYWTAYYNGSIVDSPVLYNLFRQINE
jgi:hypothetical protein